MSVARTECVVTARTRRKRPVCASLGVWLTLFAIFFGITTTAKAQLDTGSIFGTIMDSAGLVVQGASVTVRGVDTGTTYSTVSSSTGYYVFPSVRPGKYDLLVSATGFKTAVNRGVVVAVGAQTSLDIKLRVGASTETVSVTADALTLEADSAEIDQSIQPEQVENIPIVTSAWRSLESLEYVAPGVAGFGLAGSADTLKISGGQEMGTDFLIDGLTTNRQQNGSGSFGIISPSPDVINEFHVSISSMPIQEGRTTGGLANFNTKGGTNDYHGSIFEFFRNTALDANDWFDNHYQLKRPVDMKDEYGITLGGPVRIPRLYNGRNKSFFFFGWDQGRYNYGGNIHSILPTPAELGADGQYFDFSSTLGSVIPGTQGNCGQNFPLYYGEIFDPNYEYVPSQGTPCRYVAFGQTYNTGTFITSGNPTNKIPVSRASKLALNMVNTYLMPLAKQETSTSPSFNYTYRSIGTITNTGYSFRLDQNLGASHKIWAFFSSRENTDTGGNSNMPVPIQTCCGTYDQFGKITRLGWDWIISPNLVNTLTAGGNRSNNINLSKAAQMGTAWDKQFGIANGFSNDFPVFVFVGNTFPSLGQQEHSIDIDNTIAVNDALHWQRGAHSFTFGAEGQYHQYSFISQIGGTCNGNAGCFSFWDNQTASDETYWGRDGNSFAAFLLGNVGSATNLNYLHQPRWLSHYAAVFGGDTWKMKPNLTVIAGVRWSYETPRREAAGDTSIFDPNAIDTSLIPGAYGPQHGELVFAGVGKGRNGNANETWAKTWMKDFEPRVGFDWSPNYFKNKLVVRGSGGIYYGPLVYADYGQGTTQGFTATNNLYTTDPLDGVPLDKGLGVLPTSPNLNPSQLDGTGQGADYIAPSNGRPAMVSNWALETQYEVKPGWITTLGYIGNHATHMHAMLNYFNDMPDKYMALGGCLFWWAVAPCPDGWGPGNPNFVINTNNLPYANFACDSGCTYPTNEQENQALRPFPQIGYINMDSYLQNLGQSSYDALEAKLDKRFTNGLNILASYTFSKTLTDADVIQPYWSTLQNGGAVQDPENLRGEKAVSSEDIPNTFVVTYIYELPVGQGKHFLGSSSRAVDEVVGHWTVTGRHNYQSGQPMSIFGANGIPGKNSSVRFNRVAGQPVKNPNYKNPATFSTTLPNMSPYQSACATGYFNCNAFADPNPVTPATYVPYVFGNMPRNSSDIRWTGFSEESFSISKMFPINERIRVDLRGEMFNALNRHIFTRPDSNLGTTNTDVGHVGGQQDVPRQVQLHLKITY
jgi:hypothetical protein